MKPQEIKRIRDELGLTQDQLAKALEVNLRTVQKWEGGETRIRKATAFLLRSLKEGRTASRSLEIRQKYAPLDIVSHIEDYLEEYGDYEPFLKLVDRIYKRKNTISEVKKEVAELERQIKLLQHEKT